MKYKESSRLAKVCLLLNGKRDEKREHFLCGVEPKTAPVQSNTHAFHPVVFALFSSSAAAADVQDSQKSLSKDEDSDDEYLDWDKDDQSSSSTPRVRKFTQNDFTMLKVLGKGSFGKVGMQWNGAPLPSPSKMSFVPCLHLECGLASHLKSRACTCQRILVAAARAVCAVLFEIVPLLERHGVFALLFKTPPSLSVRKVQYHGQLCAFCDVVCSFQ